jgi:hypothetical protein
MYIAMLCDPRTQLPTNFSAPQLRNEKASGMYRSSGVAIPGFELDHSLVERVRIPSSQSAPASRADGNVSCFAYHGYGWAERDLNVDVEQRCLCRD